MERAVSEQESQSRPEEKTKGSKDLAKCSSAVRAHNSPHTLLRGGLARWQTEQCPHLVRVYSQKLLKNVFIALSIHLHYLSVLKSSMILQEESSHPHTGCLSQGCAGEGGEGNWQHATNSSPTDVDKNPMLQTAQVIVSTVNLTRLKSVWRGNI